MKRFLMTGLLMVGAVVVCYGQESSTARTTGQAMTRDQRIEAHNQRIQAVMGESRARRELESRRRDSLENLRDQAEAIQKSAEATTESGTSLPPIPPSRQSGLQGEEEREEAERREQAVRLENWEKLKAFYPASEVKEYRFSGDKKIFEDEDICLEWDLTGGERVLQYRWVKSPETTQTVELTTGTTEIYRHYGDVSIEITATLNQGVNIFDMRKYEQPPMIRTVSDFRLTGGLWAPWQDHFVVTTDSEQQVNDWVIYYDAGDGFYKARNTETSQAVIIGNKAKDSTAVDGGGSIHVQKVDTGGQAALIALGGIKAFQAGVFSIAESPSRFHEILGDNAQQLSVAEAVAKVGEHYDFQVEWADDDARSVGERLKYPGFRSGWGATTVAVLYLVDGILAKAETFYYEVESPDKIIVKLTEEGWTEEIEYPAMEAKMRADYVLTTEMYKPRYLSAEALARLIEPHLYRYHVSMPDKSRAEDTIMLRGKHYVIMRDSRDPRTRQVLNDFQIQRSVLETLEAYTNTRTIIVTALPETHAALRKLMETHDTPENADAESRAQDAPPPRQARLQVVLLEGGATGTTSSLQTALYDAALAEKYGITPDDAKMLGFDGAVELGRGIVDVLQEPGELGTGSITLGERYKVQVSYKDRRAPYLVLDVKLHQGADQTLVENTMLLKPGEPAFLGVTNLKGAVILIVTRSDERQAEGEGR